MDDPFQIYKEWPEATVRQALEDFKREMYSGASSSELRAGMLCFDFLTRRSDLPKLLTDYIGYSMDEANMRIQLMDIHDADQLDLARDAVLDGTIQTLQYMLRQTRGILNQVRYHYPDDVREYVRERIRSQLTQ